MTNILPTHSNQPNFVGYPYFYQVEGFICECAECATTSKEEGKTVTEQCNWDDTSLCCFTCGSSIPSAYGEDDSSEESSDVYPFDEDSDEDSSED